MFHKPWIIIQYRTFILLCVNLTPAKILIYEVTVLTQNITFGDVTWRSRGVKSDWLQVTLGRSVRCWAVLWTDVRRGAFWVSGGMRWKPVTSCTTGISLLYTPPKWSDWGAKQDLCYNQRFTRTSTPIAFFSKLILFYYFLHDNLVQSLIEKFTWN